MRARELVTVGLLLAGCDNGAPDTGPFASDGQASQDAAGVLGADSASFADSSAGDSDAALGSPDSSDALGPGHPGDASMFPRADSGDAAGTTSNSDGGQGDASGPNGPLVAYASGYGPNIFVFRVDPVTGALTGQGTTAAFGGNPSFLAVNRDTTTLFAVDESAPGRVGSYSIRRTDGALTYLNNNVSSTGDGPAFISVDATGKYVFAANYDTGTVAVLPVGAGGKLSAATDSQNAGMYAHMALVDPSNQFVFVPCLGSDYIAQYRFDAVAGKLLPNAVPQVATAPMAGPRHLAFHPSGKYVYLINETNSTMTAFAFDSAAGTLREIETQPTAPQGFVGVNTGSQVVVHPSGKLVFGSNRGDDSIVVFAIDEATGKMTLKGHPKSGGIKPWDFTVDPTGTFLYAANQDSNTIVPLRIDVTQGTLTPTASPVTVPTPSFIGIVRLPQ
ncbi:MAG TPA: lactonase family protein [Polyangiaceae bacterium]|jgi:6-phosphogluconolactonase|nr:lactonase family protein [Polyangiaceae bacterium]